MALTINQNLMAINTARNLNTAYGGIATSTRRLSSGLRIGTAADDAAGLAIREMMRSDISTINQGVRNANDAISMIQTADGALQVIDEKLIRMKELAEQAATGTYTQEQRLIIHSEYQTMAMEIQRISNATDFNGVKLLDGSLSGSHDGSGLESTGQMKVHFGTGNSSAEDYYYVNINSSKIESLFDPDGMAIGKFDEGKPMFLEATSQDLRLNTTTANDQTEPKIAGLENGNMVSVWVSSSQDGSGDGIFGQIIDQDGNKVGNEFQVNTFTNGNQSEPSVAARDDGGFVVSWTSANQDGSGTGVYAQLYDMNGRKINSEFQVNSTTANNQYRSNTVGADGGGFFTTWTSTGQDGSLDGIYGKMFDAEGNSLTSEFRINTTTNLDQRYPATARLEDGNYAVSWFSPDGSNWGIYGQIVDKNGNLIGSEYRINTTTTWLQNFQSTTSLGDGKFVVAWNNQPSSASPEFHPTAQIFNADGTKFGAEFNVNTTYMSNQMWPRLARVNDTGFVVTWGAVGQDGSGWGTFGQMYDNNGVKVGNEFQVNKVVANDQYVTDVASLKGGGFAVAYQSDDGSVDPSAVGALATIYTPVVDIQTQGRAQKSLDVLNSVIVQKDKIRASLGATQNRLSNTIQNLEIQAENLQAAESQISDVDVAQEMTAMVTNQILAQSATAMLAQANSLPKMALQLIQG